MNEFLQDVIAQEGEVCRNNLSFLLGEIGVGKTAFINWLMSTRLKEYVDNGTIWFVRLDLELLKRGKPFTPQELVYYMIHSAITVVEKHPEIAEGSEKALVKMRNVLNLKMANVFLDKKMDTKWVSRR